MLQFAKEKRKFLATAVMLFGIGLVIFFIACKERTGFHSDYTDTLIWAEASLESGSIYNPDFWYAYVLPFGGSILMIPFLIMFGVSYTTQVLGMITFSLVFFAAMYGCMKQIGLDYEQRAITVGLSAILLSVSPTTRLIFWGHVIHYSLGLLFLWVGIIIVSKLTADDNLQSKKKQLIFYILLALWCFLCCNNGFSAILFFLIPFVGSLVLERFIDLSTPIRAQRNVQSILICAIALVFSGAGILSCFLGQRNISKLYESDYTMLLPSEEWECNFSYLLRSWVTLFTEKLADRIELISYRGIQIIILFILAIVILVVPVFALISYKKYENRMMRILVLSHWVMLLSIVFCFTISPVRYTNWRMCALLGSGIVITVVYTLWLTGQEKLKRFGYALLCVLVLFSMFNTVQIAKIPSEYGSNAYDRLTEVLKAHDLSYGYSDFWFASATTILSNSTVVVRPILSTEDGKCEIRKYQSNPSWYEDQPGVERYFLYLTNIEYDYLKDTLVKESIEEIPFEEMGHILVYDYNLFGE